MSKVKELFSSKVNIVGGLTFLAICAKIMAHISANSACWFLHHQDTPPNEIYKLRKEK